MKRSPRFRQRRVILLVFLVLLIGVVVMLYEPRPTHVFSLRAFVNEWVKPVLFAVLIAFVVNLFFPKYYVEGHSMEPQFYDWDLLFSISLNIDPNPLQRGEVVTLTSPYDGARVVKRVIGLPGELVEIQDGKVFINGAALAEDYINEPPRYNGVWEVGENQYFVLGDNRNHSLDSHYYGPVDRSEIQGVVKFRYWPPNRAGAVTIPTY